MPIPDFTPEEIETVQDIVDQRYRKHVALEFADSELRLNPASRELTLCPTLFWSERGANFAVFKTGEGRYRCLFFYSASEQYGTGIEEYQDLGECVTTLLQVQADHEAQRQGF